LESATWRASPDWANILGHGAAKLDHLNQEAIRQLSRVGDAFETEHSPMVISGCVGPRGDGYVVGEAMSASDAQAYHATQIGSFSRTDADMVTAITMTYADEAIGIANAAEAAGLPAAISFTVETDGHLPSGQPLREAIAQVDGEAKRAPAYFMINCAHSAHFADPVNDSGDWQSRIQGIRANASKMSHAELDEAEELDDGNPLELGSEYRELMALLPNLNIMGGCCGTDHRHVHAIFEACS
jgi:homocysteine S-methyltransferase